MIEQISQLGSNKQITEHKKLLMTLIRVAKSWEIPEREATPQEAFFNRRRFMKSLLGAGLTGSILPVAGCGQSPASSTESSYESYPNLVRNPAFAKVDRPITAEDLAAKYNNFYEFGGGKSIWRAAQALPTADWKVEVGGLVNKPRVYDLDDIHKRFPIEERVYRFRCVEAWAMVVPWAGFPMRLLAEDVEPTSKAKFVRFTSWYDAKISTGGSGLPFARYPWPYKESLRLDEMMNELAFFATGIYGHSLPKQHGAPIREVVPWKYGFKGAKSIVKIEFLESQPATFWNTLGPNEYDFEANVNPNKPHPRWSQATERVITSGSPFSWPRRPTLPYNGYGEYVAQLYI